MKKTTICSICKINPKINTSYCSECSKEYFRTYRKNNLEKRKSDPARYKNNPKYKLKRQEYEKKYREKNGENLKKYGNEYNRSQRKKVLIHYGSQCACCGENQIEFLAIDHINGGGRQHRNSITTSIYRWIINNKFPSGFQVLCHNCNSAKSYYGVCPHMTMKQIMPVEK